VIAVHKPQTLIEVAVARSILAAHDIPYFVHNGEYASLYPGIQIDLLNVPTIMVPPSAVEAARELLSAYLPEVGGSHKTEARAIPQAHYSNVARGGMLCMVCSPHRYHYGGRT
jgi:hypothetical protein